jgi:adenylylsulfate kinase
VKAGGLVWITGLPSSGKSTFAEMTRSQLEGSGQNVVVLDGDAVREALVPKPGYDDASRDDFYATLARLAALLVRQGATVLVPATAHRRAYRDRARGLVRHFLEVWIDVPLEETRRRDAKGLYAAARGTGGTTGTLPGVGVTYEPPLAADVVARGGHDEEAVRALVSSLASAGR